MHDQAPRTTVIFPAAPERVDLLLQAFVSGLQDLARRRPMPEAEPPFLAPSAERGDLRGLLIKGGMRVATSTQEAA